MKKPQIALIVLLVIVVLGLSSFFIYDKFMKSDVEVTQTYLEEYLMPYIKYTALQNVDDFSEAGDPIKFYQTLEMIAFEEKRVM